MSTSTKSWIWGTVLLIVLLVILALFVGFWTWVLVGTFLLVYSRRGL